MRSLLINADDLGFDEDTFSVTTRLMDAGVVRSATILLDHPLTDAAIAYARANAQRCSFGLHFNIAEGRPLGGKSRPTLTVADGTFAPPIRQRLNALASRLAPVDIAAEAETQLGYLADHGVKPTHLDSHGHMHKFPAVLAALKPVLARHRITRIRLPQTLYDNQRFYSRFLDRFCMRPFRADASFHTTDHFFNTRRHDDQWFERFLRQLPAGSTELGVHPGSAEHWRRVEAAPLLDLSGGPTLPGDVRLISYHEIGQ